MKKFNWHRWWKKRIANEIARLFTIFPLPYLVIIYEKNNRFTHIEYYNSTSLQQGDEMIEGNISGSPISIDIL